MASVEDYAVLIAIIELGSITRAARKTGKSIAAVSRLLASFEKEHDIQLVNRTTRKLTATSAGLNFARRLRVVLQELDSAKEELREQRAEIGGNITIAAPTLFGPHCVMPMVSSFLMRYPKVSVDMRIADGYTNFQEENVDLAIRIGTLKDSSLKARLLGSSRRVIIASPSYIARCGKPRVPEDLAFHSCIVQTGSKLGAMWTFKVGGEARVVQVHGPLKTDSAAIVNQAVINGIGIGIAQMWQIRELVERGELRLLLADYEPDPAPINVVWSMNALPVRVRRLIDYLAANMKVNLD